MTQYNIKLSNSQISKLKSGIKAGTEVTWKFSSNVFGGTSDEKNFPCKLLLPNTHVPKSHKTFYIKYISVYQKLYQYFIIKNSIA